MTSTPTTEIAAPASRKRKAGLLLVALLVIIAAIAYLAWYLLVARYSVSTDDAYVNGNLVQLTPQIAGTVVRINADDTQHVTRGEAMVELDTADTQLALSNAEAQLARTTRQVSATYINNHFLDANIASRRAELTRAQQDLARRLTAIGSGSVSAEDLDHARRTVDEAQSALEAAQQAAHANLALSGAGPVAQHPDVLAAASKVRDTWLAWSRTRIAAPVSGYVARRSVQIGQRVAPGNQMLAIVPLDEVWVDANFKEVQLQHVRIGQPVELVADAWGGKVVYHGQVAGFSAGTGAAFAALPAQNATGNWIKVVQRLPVRITLNPRELAEHPLQIGLSMTVDVDVHQQTGANMSTTARTAFHTDVFTQDPHEADRLIEQIITANLVSDPRRGRGA
ncbi:efflux RND transporter periplasmic adaptor subunit [Silvimonas amylolytica]|uniref:Multidrug resistance protein n=1 Tax=Silvimonas amylolytica TaxID=449663 RepID=A0ABQ2PQU7_9NEIS|nr:efflux RND transporter periplasmic adaptor subunit [Silvimonas amylolytica]GGP27624.1 multidrug resistance protein [Silvimonas amylolytica]